MAFEKSVFINCPFDADYIVLLRPLIFTLVYLDFEPRLSQTKSSSQIRINLIKRHIRESMFGIHDLSRCRPLKEGEFPRFNMPYELGLDIGCIEYGGKKFKHKKILILEKEKYYYKQVLSDIGGQDIENHNDDPKMLVKKVRNWFSALNESKETYPGPSEIWIDFLKFSNGLNLKLKARGYTESDINEMPVADYIKFVNNWVKGDQKLMQAD